MQPESITSKTLVIKVNNLLALEVSRLKKITIKIIKKSSQMRIRNSNSSRCYCVKHTAYLTFPSIFMNYLERKSKLLIKRFMMLSSLTSKQMFNIIARLSYRIKPRQFLLVSQNVDTLIYWSVVTNIIFELLNYCLKRSL